jgi:hypothetical protein
MLASGTFGGLVVSMLASGTQVRGFKNPQHAFFRKGSKAVCPMSQICGMLKNPVITWKFMEVGSQRKLADHFSPDFFPC